MSLKNNWVEILIPHATFYGKRWSKWNEKLDGKRPVSQFGFVTGQQGDQAFVVLIGDGKAHGCVAVAFHKVSDLKLATPEQSLALSKAYWG